MWCRESGLALGPPYQRKQPYLTRTHCPLGPLWVTGETEQRVQRKHFSDDGDPPRQLARHCIAGSLGELINRLIENVRKQHG